jgi:hypothetical protein
MKVEVFEALLGINKGLDEAIGNLESLETIEGFGNESVQKFCMEAERLQAGINRYVAEQMRDEASQDCDRLDKRLAPEPKPQESSH